MPIDTCTRPQDGGGPPPLYALEVQGSTAETPAINLILEVGCDSALTNT